MQMAGPSAVAVGHAQIWARAQELLQAILNPDLYNLWFAPVNAIASDNETITLEVANDFSELWLKDNYLGLIQDATALASGKQLKVDFKVTSHTPLPRKEKLTALKSEALDDADAADAAPAWTTGATSCSTR